MFLFDTTTTSVVHSIEKKLYENENIPLDEFLLDTSVITSFRSGGKLTEKYIIKHKREILHESLKPDISPTVLAAFLILTSKNKYELVNEILEMDFFVDVCITHFQSGAPMSIIGRMAGLACNFLIYGFQKAQVNFHKIIFKFLDYTNNYSVMSLFTLLFSQTVNSDVHRWLLSKGLANEIAKRINSMDIEYKAPSFDDYYSKYADLYKLISIGCKNPILLECFSCTQVIVSLTHSFRFSPAYVEGAKWSAVNALITKMDNSLINLFIPMAISLLTGATHQASPDVVNCITFLTKIIPLSSDYREVLEKAQMLPIILRIIIQFQESSILSNVFLEFTNEAIKYDEFQDKILSSYIPFFMAVIYSNERSVLIPMSKKLLLDLYDYGSKNKAFREKIKSIECFNELIDNLLLKYRKKMETPYGGEIFVNIAMTVD